MGKFINEYVKPNGSGSTYHPRGVGHGEPTINNYKLDTSKTEGYLAYPAWMGSNSSPEWKAQEEWGHMINQLKYKGDSVWASKTWMRGIKDYATTNGRGVDGAKIAGLMTLATAPNLRKDDYKFVVKELTKVNQARKAAGIGQIDLLGTLIKDPVPKEYQPSTSKDIEKEVQNTLNAILKVTSTGGQSVSESTQAYTNRLDEMGKLRVRGMFNAFSGVPLLPVSQQRTPTTYNPSLGGV